MSSVARSTITFDQFLLGSSDNTGAVVLCIPDRPVPDGGRMY
jgi:hypothetical protein